MPAVYTAAVGAETAPGTLTGRSMPPGAATVRTPSLRYWRIRRALLQDELAERAGVAPVSIRRGENGQPLRLTTVRALAAALGVEPEQLMTQPPKD